MKGVLEQQQQQQRIRCVLGEMVVAARTGYVGR